MRTLSLALFGLETVEEIATRKGRGWSAKIIQLRVKNGQLPAVVIGKGRGAKFLLRTSDVDSFTPPGQGNRTNHKPRARKPQM